MTESTQIVLLDYLAKRYGKLKDNLTRLLGNDDLASDALHDAWVQLNTKGDYGKVDNPGAYVTRMTVNIAVNAHNRDSRIVSGAEADEAIRIMRDVAPGPEQVAEARSDLAVVTRILKTLPRRSRQVAMHYFGEGMDRGAVAKLLKISDRTVDRELQRIQDAIEQVRDNKK